MIWFKKCEAPRSPKTSRVEYRVGGEAVGPLE